MSRSGTTSHLDQREECLVVALVELLGPASQPRGRMASGPNVKKVHVET
jgi:hypothetical protein